MEAFDKKAKEYLAFLDNDYVSAILSIILIVYATMAAPKLPESVARVFDYTAFKLLLFFLIAYISGKNPTVAIIAAVAVLVSLMTLSKYKAGKEMMEVIKSEVASAPSVPPSIVPPQIPAEAMPETIPALPIPSEMTRQEMVGPEMAGSEIISEIPTTMAAVPPSPNTENVPAMTEIMPVMTEVIPEIKAGPEQISPEVLSEIADKPPVELSPAEFSRMAAMSCRNASRSCRSAAKSCGGNNLPMNMGMNRRPFRQPRGYDSVANGNTFSPVQ